MLDHLKFTKVDAQILNVERIRTSEVKLSGGTNGTVSSFGTVTLDPIRAETIHKTSMDIYVRAIDGAENFYKLVDVDIPLREGHNVTMILAQSNYSKPQVIYVQNHSLRDSDLTMTIITQLLLLSSKNIFEFLWRAVLIVAGIYVGGEMANSITMFIIAFVGSSIPFGYYLTKFSKSFKIKALSMLEHNDY